MFNRRFSGIVQRWELNSAVSKRRRQIMLPPGVENDVTAAVMSPASVRALMAAARSCAFVMLENAMYIQRELPALASDEALRQRTERICSELIGTKHDILTEVDELAELLTDGASDEKVATRIERIVRWLGDDVMQLHDLVQALAAAQAQDATVGAACVLVTESAANIVRAFAQTKSALSADGLVAD